MPDTGERAGRDRPILFSGPMVRALLDGRKTQTRRVLKPQPPAEFEWAKISADSLAMKPALLFGSPLHMGLRRLYRPGDRLWVRETFCDPEQDRHPVHRADLTPEQQAEERTVCRGASLEPSWRWKPSIHMPRCASRLTLVVTDVRIQRVQEISVADALAEGWPGAKAANRQPATRWFSGLWDSLNADRGFGWAANPWVVALTFTVHRCNIDAMREAA